MEALRSQHVVGVEPDAARRVDVVLDREESVQALKVYGPAPYQLVVLGPAGVSLGLDRIDLSSLTQGWHTVPLPAVTTNALAFSFEPVHEGTHDVVPEIELWAQRDEEPSRVDVASLTTTDGMVTFAATTAADEIAPGACAWFEVSLARPATQFVRTHLVYDARGPLRPWSLRRSINGTLEEGGAWLDGDTSVHTFVERIDPSTLQAGPNEVRLCAPTEATTTTSVRTLRIVGELDRGRAEAAIQVGAGSGIHAGDALTDRDAATSLAIAAGEPIVLEFDHRVAPDALVVEGSSMRRPP